MSPLILFKFLNSFFGRVKLAVFFLLFLSLGVAIKRVWLYLYYYIYYIIYIYLLGYGFPGCFLPIHFFEIKFIPGGGELEVQVTSRCSHPHKIQVYTSIESTSQKTFRNKFTGIVLETGFLMSNFFFYDRYTRIYKFSIITCKVVMLRWSDKTSWF